MDKVIDMPHLATEQRQDYVDRLLKRTSEIWHREAPKEIGKTDEYWVFMAGPDRDLIRTATAYEKGEVEKAVLDKAALYLLAEWRKQFALLRLRK